MYKYIHFIISIISLRAKLDWQTQTEQEKEKQTKCAFTYEVLI